MKLIRFLINSNIYVALGAVFLTLETQVQLGMHPQFHPYLFIIFFATLVDYNFHRLTTVILHKEALQTEKHRWVRENLNLFYALVIASVLGFFIALTQAKREVLITLTPIALITLFYTVPFFKSQKSIFRLRDIPGLKIFLISFVWAAVTIFLPIIQSGLIVDKLHVFWMFIERFLFTMAITIPFDIRDQEVDLKQGLSTLPIWIGIDKSILLAVSMIWFFMGIAILHYWVFNQLFMVPAFIMSGLTTIYFLKNKKFQKLTHYHYGILDGTILFQGLMVCISYWVH